LCRPALARESGASPKLVRVSVTGTGIEMDREDLETIFRPFEQVENSASRSYQETGL